MNFLHAIPKEKLQRIVLTVVLAVAGVIVAGNLYVARQFSIWSGNKQRIVTLKRQIEEADRNAKQAGQSQQMRAQVAAFLEAQRAAMVSGDPFAWVVRQISLLAERHPVRVLAMRPGSKAAHALKPHYEVFTAQIDIEASYDQLGMFLQDFENKFPTTEIRSLEISPIDVNSPRRRALLQVAFLVQPESAPQKAAGKSDEEKKT